MKTNETYSLMVERCNRDYKTWQREQTFVNGRGVWERTYNITKLQYNYGVNDTLYYTKTLIKFKKTSSSAPVFVYYTVHFDDNGGDLNTYPKDFINQIYLVAYGVEGIADNVDPEVYDAHEAFEIINCYVEPITPQQQPQLKGLLKRKSDNQIVSFPKPVVLHAIIIKKTFTNSNQYLDIRSRGLGEDVRILLNNFPRTTMEIFEYGIWNFRFHGTGSQQFDVIIAASDF